MIDKTFWGLVETQLEALKNADGKEANTLLLETAKLLISQIDVSEKVITEYDKFDMRELFAAYSDFASETVSFYTANQDKLDPAALNGKLGQKLSSATAEVQAVSSALKSLKETEEELIRAETEFETMKKEYDSLLEKVSSLRAIRDTMTPAVLKTMKEEIDNLEAEIKKSSKEHGKLKKELDKVNDEYQEICKELSILADSKIEKCDQLVDVITRHFDTLRVLFENEQISAAEMLAKIAEYKELYKKLEESVSETSDVLALYELQMGENSKIVDSMKKYGVKSLASALDDIERIKKTIEEDIKAYDMILQKVLKGEEDIRKEIERRQGKHA